MYEELKMVLELLGDLGAYAVWVAVAYFVFKLTTLASYVLLAKYFITKVWEWAMKEKEQSTVLSIDGYLIDGASGTKLLNAILEVREYSRYIHVSDVQWLQDAIQEKKERDRKSN